MYISEPLKICANELDAKKLHMLDGCKDAANTQWNVQRVNWKEMACSWFFSLLLHLKHICLSIHPTLLRYPFQTWRVLFSLPNVEKSVCLTKTVGHSGCRYTVQPLSVYRIFLLLSFRCGNAQSRNPHQHSIPSQTYPQTYTN